MRERIAGFCELLLLALVRALLPARGRHRAPLSPPTARERLSVPAPTSPSRSGRLPDDVRPYERDTPLVRPYLLTAAEHRERRLRRQRRRALRPAVHGIDIGPRFIHGVEVSA